MSRSRLIDGGQVRIERSSRGVVLSLEARREWLRSAGYLRPEGPPESRAREVFHQSPRRENAVRDDGPDGLRLYDKRALALGLGKRVRTWLRGGTGGSLCLHEWRVLRHARSHGLRVPEPWAAGERRDRGIPRSGFLLTRELEGTALAEIIRDEPLLPRDARRRLAVAVAQAVAHLHGAGIAFHALWAKHVIVAGADEALRVGFLDLATARLHRGRPPWRARIRDLATLAGSLPRGSFPLSDRHRFLTHYLDATDDALPVNRLWRPLVEATRRVLLDRRQRPCAALRSTRTSHAGEDEDPVLFRGRRAGTAFLLFEPGNAATPVARPSSEPALVDLLDRICDAGVIPPPNLETLVRAREDRLYLAAETPLEVPRPLGPRAVARIVDTLEAAVMRLAPDDAARARLVDHLEAEAEDRLLLRRPRGILGA